MTLNVASKATSQVSAPESDPRDYGDILLKASSPGQEGGGWVKALPKLARYHREGWGVEKSPEIAAGFDRLATLAKQQESVRYCNRRLGTGWNLYTPIDQRGLANRLMDDSDIQNKKAALSLYYLISQSPGAKDHPQVFVALGDLYSNGQVVPKDNQKAIRYYEKVPSQEAHYRLGCSYLSGIGVIKDEEKGVSLLEKALSLTYRIKPSGRALAARASKLLADFYLNGGDKVKPDIKKALENYSSVVTIDSTDLSALCMKALLLGCGKTAADVGLRAFLKEVLDRKEDLPCSQVTVHFRNPSEANRELLKKATKLYIGAAEQLREVPEQQRIFAELQKGILNLFNKRREWGDPEVGSELARYEYACNHSSLDRGKSALLMELEARKGDLPAIVGTGSNYLEGNGLPTDLERGNELLVQAWERSKSRDDSFEPDQTLPDWLYSKKAQKWAWNPTPSTCIHIYRKLVTDPNFELKAEEWLDRTEETAEILMEKAAHCEKGIGGSYDLKKAYEYYLAAVKKGNPEAMCEVGNFYRFGKGGVVVKDEKKAYALYMLAARLHSEQGLYNACALKLDNPESWNADKGTRSDAAKMIEKLADKGMAEAMFVLGGLYRRGDGGKVQDSSKAYELTQKAANLGLPHALYSLGWMYLSAFDGIPRAFLQDDSKRRKTAFALIKRAIQLDPSLEKQFNREYFGMSDCKKPRPYR